MLREAVVSVFLIALAGMFFVSYLFVTVNISEFPGRLQTNLLLVETAKAPYVYTSRVVCSRVYFW